jgi:hypothetical protein
MFEPLDQVHLNGLKTLVWQGWWLSIKKDPKGWGKEGGGALFVFSSLMCALMVGLINNTCSEIDLFIEVYNLHPKP